MIYLFFQIIAIDPDREAYETGLPFIQKANMTHKIQFIQSDAMPVLKDLLAKVYLQQFISVLAYIYIALYQNN